MIIVWLHCWMQIIRFFFLFNLPHVLVAALLGTGSKANNRLLLFCLPFHFIFTQMIGSEVLNLLQVLVVKQKGKKNLDFNSLLLLVVVVVSYIRI